jgi:murein DD-endopeptidase MepM/ murein hydrolase activator NlpD
VTTASRCATCGGEIALWAARPRITADGNVVVECDPCSRGEKSLVAVEVVQPPAPRRSRRRAWISSAASAAAVVGVCLIGASSAQRPRPAQAERGHGPQVERTRPTNWNQATTATGDEESAVAVIDDVFAPDAVPPELPAMPEREGEPLDEWFPTLHEWVHPVPGSPDVIPTKASRLFGAKRDGHDQIRSECAGGHCGVDLEGVRGQPVVAVAWGTVVKIQTDPDRIGGRYVRIEHPDFVYTTYFHLDRVAEGLKVGQEVEPGTTVGALGASGIHVSMPHLHFALELPDESGSVVRFVDPVPFLARSEVLPAPSETDAD